MNLYYPEESTFIDYSKPHKANKKIKSFFYGTFYLGIFASSPLLCNEQGSLSIMENFEKALSQIDDEDEKKALEREIKNLKNLRGSSQEKIIIMDMRKKALEKNLLLVEKKKAQLKEKQVYYEKSRQKIKEEMKAIKNYQEEQKENLRKHKDIFREKGQNLGEIAQKLIQNLKADPKENTPLILEDYEKNNEEFNNAMNIFFEKKFNHKDTEFIEDLSFHVAEGEKDFHDKIIGLLNDVQEDFEILQKTYLFLLALYEGREIVKKQKNESQETSESSEPSSVNSDVGDSSSVNSDSTESHVEKN